MRQSAGFNILLRCVAILAMASFCAAFAGSRAPDPKLPILKPHFKIEYYISDGETVCRFDKSGLSIYSFSPAVRDFDADGLDEIPLFGVVDDGGINAMDLDSVFVQTAERTLFYDFTKQRASYFFQDFVQNVREDATVQMFYSATLGKAVLKNLVVANDGQVPVALKVPLGEKTLSHGESETITFATDLHVYPKLERGERLDSMYMSFSVEIAEDALESASQSTLDALDSLRFIRPVSSDTVNFESVLKAALKVLDRDGDVEFGSVLFKVEFFATAHKHLHSFVFTKDLDSTFYDETWKDSISMADGGGDFPVVYRADACFDGWSVVDDGRGGKLFRSSDFDMALLRSEDEVLVLKPNWKFGPECAGVEVTLAAEHGGVELLHVVPGDTVVRAFRNSLRVPRSENGLAFIVRAVPDSAYVLDGEIPQNIRVKGPTRIDARFVPGPDPEPLMVIVESGLEVSGNAARLRYCTGEMNILRKVGFRVTVRGPEGYLADTLLVDSAESTVLEGEWRLVPAPVGEYVVEAKVFHDLDSARYVDTLRVAGEIAVDTGAWAMVSLSGVDMEKLKWDDDQLFFHWDESFGGAEYMQYRRLKRKDEPSAVDGYWYNSLEGRALPLVSEVAGEAAFAWELDSLNSGWNLVANPHGYYVDLRAGDAGDSVQFWRWNPQTREYEMPTVIGPYEAVWAKVDRAVLWELDGEPVFDSSLWDGPALTRMALAKEGARDDGWEFRVVLGDGQGHLDSWNFLGASARAVNREEPPAAMGDRVDLAVLGEHGGRLARSVKPLAKDGAYEWTLELQAGSDRDAYVSFAGIGDLGARGLHVYFTVDGETTEISEGDSVRVRLMSRATVATVRVAPEPRSPASSALSGLEFRQSSGQLFVEFDAGNALSGLPARVELLDLHGRVVASTAIGTREGGNAASLRVDRPGIFVARVRVGGRSLASRVVFR